MERPTKPWKSVWSAFLGPFKGMEDTWNTENASKTSHPEKIQMALVSLEMCCRAKQPLIRLATSLSHGQENWKKAE